MKDKIIAIIPAYKPDDNLVDVIKGLSKNIYKIVIVDDGSGDSFKRIFNKVKSFKNVILLAHSINMGKGAAIKTALNRIKTDYPECSGVVTADADGQHLTSDIIKVIKSLKGRKRVLVMGIRSFDNNVPTRSMLGNKLTSFFMKMLYNINLKDTQTGLRCFSVDFIHELLIIPFNRYEFELEMLLKAKKMKYEIEEVSIQTVYIEKNVTSHFNPIIDSIKIYIVLFRYFISSMLTALIDYTIFIFCSGFIHNILLNTYLARMVALIVNYLLVRNIVFHSRKKVSKTLPFYILLVATSGFISASIISFLMDSINIGLVKAKIMAEGIIYIANFVIQKELIFKSNEYNSENAITDWDKYYSKPYKTASFTRKITEHKIINLMKKHIEDKKTVIIAELGGANSCFFESINNEIKPVEYHIIDNNQLGLDKFKKRIGQMLNVKLHNLDIINLQFKLEKKPNVVFSVGLIEHFSENNTKKAIEAHFDILNDGGIVLITFPTPTILYKIIRFGAELLKLWIFHDERPLSLEEVVSIIENYGQVLHKSITWSVLLTQGVIVAKK